MENLVLLGALASAVTQVLKYTPIPTERPKLVAFIVGLVLVLVPALYSGGVSVVTENALAYAEQVGIVSVVGVGLYEFLKTAYGFLTRAI